MAEHIHEWRWSAERRGDSWFCCKTCEKVIHAGEIERRLNATERLSASEAVRAASSLYFPKTPGYERLMAYASALEGKNGTE